MIVGFNFTKMAVEKKKPIKGKVNIANNMKITNVESQDLSLGKSKEAGIRYTFEFSAKYEPGMAEISFSGEILDLQEEKTAKALIDSWKKDKKIDPKVMDVLLRTIFARCNLKAIVLSQEVGLPSPVPLPKLQTKKK